MADPSSVSRRDFVKAVGASAMVPRLGAEAPAETAVARFVRTLTTEQKRRLAFPFGHPLRSVVRNNWKVVETRIEDLSGEQRALCREIFEGLCSADGLARFDRQMADDYGGFAKYHVAAFGEPGAGPLEWVLTGRHVTVRADGLSGTAARGPIFLGHASRGRAVEDRRHADNVWWHQGRRANAIFAAFDEEQKTQSLGAGGLAVSTLGREPKAAVQALLRDLVSPFRAFDAPEIAECLDPIGGADKMRLAFSGEDDLGPDGVWDVWKLEGPAFAWYYHASPHVHSWVVM